MLVRFGWGPRPVDDIVCVVFSRAAAGLRPLNHRDASTWLLVVTVVDHVERLGVVMLHDVATVFYLGTAEAQIG